MKKIMTTLLLISISFSAFAWGNTGHKIIGAIAYDYLTPKTKKAVNALLEIPISNPGSVAISKKYGSFVNATFWPDAVREHDGALRPYHYIPLTFSVGTEATKENATKALRDFRDNNPNKDKQVGYAVEAAIRTISINKNDYSRAIALRSLLHFTGDIHQPIHVGEPMINNKRTVIGLRVKLGEPFEIPATRDGTITNSYIKYADNYHQVWDYGFGGFVQYIGKERLITRKDMIIKDFAEQDALRCDTIADVDDWLKESWMISLTAFNAIDYTVKDDTVYVTPTNEFIKMYQYVCLEQLYISGKRLANTLNALFDPDSAATPKAFKTMLKKIDYNYKISTKMYTEFQPVKDNKNTTAESHK